MSHSVEAGGQQPSAAATLFWLLDPAFGYFLWAAHFLIVYIAEAVACVLGLGRAGGGAHAALLAALVVVTGAAAAVLVIHAVWRYWQQRNLADQRFRMSVTIGNDAIAAMAILWQLFPIFLTPVCA
ncbi:MAG: hypothetical protein ACJ8AW_12200 [Rhodopila sp.]